MSLNGVFAGHTNHCHGDGDQESVYIFDYTALELRQVVSDIQIVAAKGKNPADHLQNIFGNTLNTPGQRRAICSALLSLIADCEFTPPRNMASKPDPKGGRLGLTDRLYLMINRLHDDPQTFSAAYYYDADHAGCDFRVSGFYHDGSADAAMRAAFDRGANFLEPIRQVLRASIFDEQRRPGPFGVHVPPSVHTHTQPPQPPQKSDPRTHIATREIGDSVRLTAGLMPDGTWQGKAKYGEATIAVTNHAKTKDECQGQIEHAYRLWLMHQCGDMNLMSIDMDLVEKQKKELEDLREFKRKVLAGTHKPFAVRPWRREKGTPVIGEEHVHLVGPAGASIIVDTNSMDPAMAQDYADRVRKKTGHEILLLFPSKGEEVIAVEYDTEPFRKKPW